MTKSERVPRATQRTPRGCVKESRVNADGFAAGVAGQGSIGAKRDGALDEPRCAVGEQEMNPAGMPTFETMIRAPIRGAAARVVDGRAIGAREGIRRHGAR